MRGTKDEAFHDPSFLDDLIEQAKIPLGAVNHVEMRSAGVFDSGSKSSAPSVMGNF